MIQKATCSRCHEEKGIDEFYKDRSKPLGIRYDCKECFNKTQDNSEENKAQRRGYYLNVYRFKKFGITKDRYDQAYELQGGACFCGRSFEEDTPHVDHDHSCCSKPPTCGDCFRGLLCRGCNLIIGIAYDTPDRLRLLANYLEKGAIQ